MERKKIILVAGSVYPDASATGNICYQIAKELSPKYDVHIIAMLNTYTPETEVCTPDGLHVSLERTFWFALRQWFTSRNIKFGLNIVRAIDRLLTLIWLPKNTWWYSKRVKKILCSTAQKDSEFTVISFSEPFESHWGVLQARKKNVNFKWISIFEDSFAVALNKKNLFMSLNKLSQMEQSVLEQSDHVFVTPEIYNTRIEFCEKYEYKMCMLPYLIKNNIKKNEESHNKTIRMIYAGRFYNDIRPPQLLLDFFISLQMPNVTLDIFTAGEGENIVKRYSDSSEGRICLHNMISQQQLLDEYAQSDILINMENNIKEFKPSKQYEYIGTGKPIISFYYFEPDKELDKYPLALQLNANRLNESVDIVKEFIMNSKGKSLSFDEIFTIYPENTIDQIRYMLENKIE